MATRVISELGLDGGGFPDLTDSATRHKLSSAAIAAFFKIAELWDLDNDTAMSLLGGVSHGRYYALKRTHKGVLTQDELTRVSLLIGIFKSLNILFSHKLANQWVSRPNSNSLFHNEPPRILMTLGGVPGMLTVRRLLDGRRGGR
ncbi:MAG: antitoxin Xre-like helix-turn-helix domain-containing protein [Terriglobales bacterium]|jgi:uncharacterized protein (DUF2384 family)